MPLFPEWLGTIVKCCKDSHSRLQLELEAGSRLVVVQCQDAITARALGAELAQGLLSQKDKPAALISGLGAGLNWFKPSMEITGGRQIWERECFRIFASDSTRERLKRSLFFQDSAQSEAVIREAFEEPPAWQVESAGVNSVRIVAEWLHGQTSRLQRNLVVACPDLGDRLCFNVLHRMATLHCREEMSAVMCLVLDAKNQAPNRLFLSQLEVLKLQVSTHSFENPHPLEVELIVSELMAGEKTADIDSVTLSLFQAAERMDGVGIAAGYPFQAGIWEGALRSCGVLPAVADIVPVCGDDGSSCTLPVEERFEAFAHFQMEEVCQHYEREWKEKGLAKESPFLTLPPTQAWMLAVALMPVNFAERMRPWFSPVADAEAGAVGHHLALAIARTALWHFGDHRLADRIIEKHCTGKEKSRESYLDWLSVEAHMAIRLRNRERARNFAEACAHHWRREAERWGFPEDAEPGEEGFPEALFYPRAMMELSNLFCLGLSALEETGHWPEIKRCVAWIERHLERMLWKWPNVFSVVELALFRLMGNGVNPDPELRRIHISSTILTTEVYCTWFPPIRNLPRLCFHGGAYLRAGFITEALLYERVAIRAVDQLGESLEVAAVEFNCVWDFLTAGVIPSNWKVLLEHAREQCIRMHQNIWASYAWYLIAVCHHVLGEYPEAEENYIGVEAFLKREKTQDSQLNWIFLFCEALFWKEKPFEGEGSEETMHRCEILLDRARRLFPKDCSHTLETELSFFLCGEAALLGHLPPVAAVRSLQNKKITPFLASLMCHMNFQMEGPSEKLIGGCLLRATVHGWLKANSADEVLGSPLFQDLFRRKYNCGVQDAVFLLEKARSGLLFLNDLRCAQCAVLLGLLVATGCSRVGIAVTSAQRDQTSFVMILEGNDKEFVVNTGQTARDNWPGETLHISNHYERELVRDFWRVKEQKGFFQLTHSENEQISLFVEDMIPEIELHLKANVIDYFETAVHTFTRILSSRENQRLSALLLRRQGSNARMSRELSMILQKERDRLKEVNQRLTFANGELEKAISLERELANAKRDALEKAAEAAQEKVKYADILREKTEEESRKRVVDMLSMADRLNSPATSLANLSQKWAALTAEWEKSQTRLDVTEEEREKILTHIFQRTKKYSQVLDDVSYALLRLSAELNAFRESACQILETELDFRKIS